MKHHVGAPLERVSVDILGPFTKSNRGNTCVIMLVDMFTKWVEAYPIPNQQSEVVAEKIVTEFFMRFGCANFLLTDQGSNFMSHVFKDMCELLEISKVRTSPYRPQSNAQVERFNRTVLDLIRCLIKNQVKDWDVYLPYVTSAIRAMQHRRTGFSANKLMLNRDLTRPVDILYGIPRSNPLSYAESVKNMDEIMRKSHAIVREHLRASMRYQKRIYDKKLNFDRYQIGDFVYKLRAGNKKGVSSKLLSIWEGPYIISDIKSPVLFVVQGRKKSWVLHHDRLKPCHDRVIPLWVRRKRQEILKLDETIAYDQDEFDIMDSPEGIGLLYSSDDSQLLDEPNSADQLSSDDSLIEQEIVGTNVSAPVITTRTGRKVKLNSQWKDYVTY